MKITNHNFYLSHSITTQGFKKMFNYFGNNIAVKTAHTPKKFYYELRKTKLREKNPEFMKINTAKTEELLEQDTATLGSYQ